MQSVDYFGRLKSATVRVAEVLSRKGVASDRLCFGGEGALPSKKPRIPLEPNSNFLGNRAMGDWAESVLKELLVGSPVTLRANHGKSGALDFAIISGLS